MGKALVKEESGSDRGVTHASDSERTTTFVQGGDRRCHVRDIKTKVSDSFGIKKQEVQLEPDNNFKKRKKNPH